MVLVLLLACTPAPAPHAPAPEPVDAAPDAAPPGRIGGEPILAMPTVVGALSTDAVERGVDAIRPRIADCWASNAEGRERAFGKVLVRFVVTVDGGVARATTHSTSLRHPPTEDCIVGELASARFAPPSAGDKAVVLYPLAFPP